VNHPNHPVPPAAARAETLRRYRSYRLSGDHPMPAMAGIRDEAARAIAAWVCGGHDLASLAIRGEVATFQAARHYVEEIDRRAARARARQTFWYTGRIA
jgi:hypothetical protein